MSTKLFVYLFVAVAVVILLVVTHGVTWVMTQVGFGGVATKLRRSLSLALKSLWLHKLRSFLSVLGIIIGVASVIALMAFGEGSMQDALEDIKRQGATNIIVRSVKPADNSQANTRAFVTTYGLTQRDLDRIRTFGGAIVRIVPIRVFPTEVPFRDRTLPVRVIATTPEYGDIHKFQMAGGRFLTEVDEHDSKNICVLGSDVADKLFPFENALGREIELRGDNFTVVGVIRERMATGGSGGSQAAEEFNKDIYVPLKTSVDFFGEVISVRTAGARMNDRVQYNQITITVSDIDKVRPVGNAIKSMLDQEHGMVQDWVVTVPLDILEQAERAKARFLALMAMIASISLLVGGIGIMNIMLATVTERTREIGIRRALGAKQKDITLQFLIEAVVQTTIGGLCGVVFGFVMIYVFPPLYDILRGWGWIEGPPLFTKIHVPIIFIALTFSVVVGVVFGLYPAWRASRLDPIEALRHD
jgi:putative ABC transport system permease protein